LSFLWFFVAVPEEYLDGEGFSRKGAEAQSATAFLSVFLAAFAPLREKNFRAFGS
jgi:hypothetical protein